MKKIMTAGAAVLLLAAGAITAPADAATTPKYKNCTQMHAKYKGGIAKKGAKDKRANGGHAKYKPVVNTTWYNANKSMDRDKDGIACEQ